MKYGKSSILRMSGFWEDDRELFAGTSRAFTWTDYNNRNHFNQHPFQYKSAATTTRPQTQMTWTHFFPPEGGVGLVPKRGCLLTLEYYAFPRWYEFGERRWNDTDRGNRRTRRKTCPSATLSTTNTTWIDPGANPGFRGDRPEANDLSHGTAYEHNYQYV
jgi:hypothetical protein